MREATGLLILDKPAGPTSHDVVERIRTLYGVQKVGHAGTLDPPATGVLLAGVGRATRILQFLQTLPKSYRAEVEFGVTTTTHDAAGEIVATRPCHFGRDQLEREAASLIGEIEQVPPMVSAVKIGGERLYRAARRGDEIERPARKVRVYQFDIESFDPNDFRASIFVRCSSGTYVRALAADLGDRLGCGAHLAGLRRVAVGSFDESESVSLEQLEGMPPGRALEKLVPMPGAMRDFPSITVAGSEEIAVRHGRPLDGQLPAARERELPVLAKPRIGEAPAHKAGMTAGIPVAVLSRSGELLAVYRRSRGGLRPAAVLAGAAEVEDRSPDPRRGSTGIG
jgi:tRNA pseudouridine55 synthase